MKVRAETYRMRVDGVRFRGRHGASRAERDLFQDFVASVEIDLPTSALPKSDNYRSVFDYDKIAALVVDLGTTTSFKLLETLAGHILERLLTESPALAATVRITKFGPPTTASVEQASIELFARRSG